MLVLKDCAIDPGDILFVVSNSRKFFVRLKQAAQAFTTPGNQHGHMEVVTVFVCTDKTEHGIICHNYERQLLVSTDKYIQSLNEKSIEELTELLLNYCSKRVTIHQIKQALSHGPHWIKDLLADFPESDNADKLIQHILLTTQENKERLMQLIVLFWRASGQAEILPFVNSSLLVFKHSDSKQREEFLRAYREQVKVTQRVHEQGKNRTSYWEVIKSLFQWSNKQGKKDKKSSPPSVETFCSSNVMQVLNQVNPNLVNRGSNVIPKALEAGLREATKSKNKAEVPVNEDQLDDLEALIAAEEQSLPPFKLQILPATGKELIRTLLAEIDIEINRIENKQWINQKDREKANDLKRLLLPFRHSKYQSYPVELQVDIALELIAKIVPVLQRKTGFWGAWIPSTSYANLRAFARTQGIFDGDIREAVEKLKDKSLVKTENPDEVVIEESGIVPTGQIYIFSDWSFYNWSSTKREQMLQYMLELMHAGHSLYTWQNGQLVLMSRNSLIKAIHGEDFDDLLASKLKPANRAMLLQQATDQQLNATQFHFLDYKGCRDRVEDHSFEKNLLEVAPIFSTNLDEVSLSQTMDSIIEMELSNPIYNERERLELEQLRKSIEMRQEIQQTTYQSGIDTKAFVSQSPYRKPVFKPLGSLSFTPSTKYYRNEVYPELAITERPASPFEYFELRGMNATKNLTDCEYVFHPEGFTKELFKKRKNETDLVLLKGDKKLTLSKNWQALPSVHPGESLLDIAIKGLKKEDFEIKYSKENHLYFIRLCNPTAEPQEFFTNLLLRMPKQYRAHPIFNTLSPNPKHQEIHGLLTRYLKFGKDHGELRNSIGVKVHNGIEYLEEARRLGVASCRLRAIAFKEEMQRLYPEVPVCISGNPDHCFIEMELDGQWGKYCLGGYRDTPGLIDSIKENHLTCGESDSKRPRFFGEKEQSKPNAPVDQKLLSNIFA